MQRYEYDVTVHGAESFQDLVYFCTSNGACSAGQVPAEQPAVLIDLLNQRGREGWELVQLAFGKDGVTGIWKRELA